MHPSTTPSGEPGAEGVHSQSYPSGSVTKFKNMTLGKDGERQQSRLTPKRIPEILPKLCDTPPRFDQVAAKHNFLSGCSHEDGKARQICKFSLWGSTQ